MKYNPVYIGIGANIGDPFKQICQALTLLDLNENIELNKISSIFLTQPLYNPNQPDFLNLVVEIATNLEPEELLKFCKNIEKRLGRQPTTQRNAPRVIDLDILYFADQILEQDGLNIPHPRITERLFVLVPLAEIAPKLQCPKSKKTITQLLKTCPDKSRIEKTSLIPIFYQEDGAL